VVAASGGAQSVVLEYEKFLAKKATASPPAAHALPAHEGTHAKLLDVVVVGADGVPK
jgi:hypothetical protein